MSLRYRILVVEDDSNVRELIRAHLAATGFDVHTAHNGLEGLERVKTMKPDAMLLDINMPEMDGFSVLETLKVRGWIFPVLVLSARHASEDVRRAVSLGAKDYLTKPFTEMQLKARVARLLRAPAPIAPSTQVLVG